MVCHFSFMCPMEPITCLISRVQLPNILFLLIAEGVICFRYTLPTCVKFDLGLAPVYWKTSDGLLCSTVSYWYGPELKFDFCPPNFMYLTLGCQGGKLTIFHNPLNKLVPDNKFGIAFNGNSFHSKCWIFFQHCIFPLE